MFTLAGHRAEASDLAAAEEIQQRVKRRRVMAEETPRLLAKPEAISRRDKFLVLSDEYALACVTDGIHRYIKDSRGDWRVKGRLSTSRLVLPNVSEGSSDSDSSESEDEGVKRKKKVLPLATLNDAILVPALNAVLIKTMIVNDGTKLALFNQNGIVRSWSIKGVNLPYAFTILPNEHALAWDDQGSAWRINLRSEAAPESAPHFKEGITTFAVTCGMKRLVLSRQMRLDFFDVESEKRRSSMELSIYPSSLVTDPSGKHVIATNYLTLIVINVENIAHPRVTLTVHVRNDLHISACTVRRVILHDSGELILHTSTRVYRYDLFYAAKSQIAALSRLAAMPESLLYGLSRDYLRMIARILI